jgi:hypothetical protein
MKLIWQVEPQDIEQVRAFYQAHQNDPFVQERQRRNLAESKPPLTKSDIWQVLVSCLLTTQQRSGPQTAITRFVSIKPFPLNYDLCLSQDDVEPFAYQVLNRFGGIRRSHRLADEISTNFRRLEQGLWGQTMAKLDILRQPHNQQLEREAAEFVDHQFKGFGPKQSRDLLQLLGLTCYEIPIDSRITEWLGQFGFPFSAKALVDPSCYAFVSDGFQQLCEQSDILPCLLDAAIFASFDDGGWTEGNVVWEAMAAMLVAGMSDKDSPV